MKRKAFTEVMEATPANVSHAFNPRMAEPSERRAPPGGVSFDFYADLMETCDTRRKSNSKSQHLQESFTDQTAGAGPMMQAPSSPPGVSNCYVFKSRLQEYAQKVGLASPAYETIKEGPSHQPSFKSTVIVSGVIYDSLPGFLNRKAAEQSAAEIALMELSKCGQSKDSIFAPVHETGLCKNLLQDYSQKMNYAIPTYTFKKDELPNRTLPFSCTVEIGGIRYIGASAKTRKEAEIKAARTALLAIQSSSNDSVDNLNSKSHHVVVPPKRKAPETDPSLEAEKPKKKPKRSRRFKKKRHNPRHCGQVNEQIPPENMDIVGSTNSMGSSAVVEKLQHDLSDVQVTDYGGNVSEKIRHKSVDVSSNNDIGTPTEVEQVQRDISSVQVLPDYEQTPHSSPSSLKHTNESLKINQHDGEASRVEGSLVPQADRCQDSGISQGDPEPSIEDTNHERENTASTNVSPVIADPLVNQKVGPPVSETEVPGEPEPALAGTNHEREENTAGTNVSPITAFPPVSQELGPPVLEIEVGPREPEPSLAKMFLHLTDSCRTEREESTAGTNVGPVIADPPANQELGLPVSENEVSPGEPELALDETNLDREKNTAGTNVAAVIADPPANQELGPTVSETNISLGEPESALADTNREREENTAGTNVGAVIADPTANQELGPPVSKTKISSGESEPALADTNCEREENTAGTNVGPVIVDLPANEELGPPVLETEVNPGEPEPASADTNHEGEENAVGTNVGVVVADSPANQKGPLVSGTEISPGDPELAMEDRSHERKDNDNDAGANGDQL